MQEPNARPPPPTAASSPYTPSNMRAYAQGPAYGTPGHYAPQPVYAAPRGLAPYTGPSPSPAYAPSHTRSHTPPKPAYENSNPQTKRFKSETSLHS